MTRDELLELTSADSTEAQVDAAYAPNDTLKKAKQDLLRQNSAQKRQQFGKANASTFNSEVKVVPDWVDQSSPSWLTEGGRTDVEARGEWVGNKIWNDLTDQEQNYNTGRAYKEFGIAPVWDDPYSENRKAEKFINVNDGSDYTGPIDNRGLPEGYGWLYDYGAEGSDEWHKMGVHNRTDDPKDRYEDKSKIGATGVDTSKTNMEILLPSPIVDTHERSRHGDASVLEGRVYPGRYGSREFGTGSTEVYKSKEALYGNELKEERRSQEQLDKTYQEFLKLAGVSKKEPAQAVNPIAAVRSTMLQRESSGNYQQPGNEWGYMGGYQFGGEALINVGLADPQLAVDYPIDYNAPVDVRNAQRKAQNEALADPKYWTGAEGIRSKEDYLQSPEVQDKAFDALASRNLNTLIKAGIVTEDTPADEIAGYIAAAHLGGAGNVAKGKMNVEDKLGTNLKEYFDLGRNSVGQQIAGSSTYSDPYEKALAEYKASRDKKEGKSLSLGGAFTTGLGVSAYGLLDLGVETAGDLVGAGVSLFNKEAGQWIDTNIDIATETEMRKQVSDLVGYDGTKSQVHMKAAEKHYDKAMEKVELNDPSSWSNVDMGSLWEASKEAFADLDSTAYSVGYLVPALLGVVGKLGTTVLSKELQIAKKELLDVAESDLSKEDKKARMAEIGDNLSKADKTKLFLVKHADILALGGVMNNAQLDEYMANNGGEEATLARSLGGWVANSVALKVDVGLVDSALKGKGALVDHLVKQFSTVDKPIAAKMVVAATSFGAKAAAAGLKEAPQEWVQSYIEAFNKVYGTDNEDGTKVDFLQAAEGSIREANIGAIYGAAGGLHMGIAGQTGALLNPAVGGVNKGFNKVKETARNFRDSSDVEDELSTNAGPEKVVTEEEQVAYEVFSDAVRSSQGSTEEGIPNYKAYVQESVNSANAMREQINSVRAAMSTDTTLSEEERAQEEENLNKLDKELTGNLNKVLTEDFEQVLAAGRPEEIRAFKQAVMEQVPGLLKSYGSNEDMIDTVGKTTGRIIEDDITRDGVLGDYSSTIDALKQVNPDVARLVENSYNAAKNVSDYLKSATGKSLGEVSSEVIVGPRGLLSYYYSGKKSEEAKEKALANVERLYGNQVKKQEKLRAGLQEVQDEITQQFFTQNSDATPQEIAKEYEALYNEYLRNKKVKQVVYGKVGGEAVTVSIPYSMVARNLLAQARGEATPEQTGAGIYGIAKTLDAEIEIADKVFEALSKDKELVLASESTPEPTVDSVQEKGDEGPARPVKQSSSVEPETNLNDVDPTREEMEGTKAVRTRKKGSMEPDDLFTDSVDPLQEEMEEGQTEALTPEEQLDAAIEEQVDVVNSLQESVDDIRKNSTTWRKVFAGLGGINVTGLLEDGLNKEDVKEANSRRYKVGTGSKQAFYVTEGKGISPLEALEAFDSSYGLPPGVESSKDEAGMDQWVKDFVSEVADSESADLPANKEVRTELEGLEEELGRAEEELNNLLAKRDKSVQDDPMQVEKEPEEVVTPVEEERPLVSRRKRAKATAEEPATELMDVFESIGKAAAKVRNGELAEEESPQRSVGKGLQRKVWDVVKKYKEDLTTRMKGLVNRLLNDADNTDNDLVTDYKILHSNVINTIESQITYTKGLLEEAEGKEQKYRIRQLQSQLRVYNELQTQVAQTIEEINKEC